MSGTFDLRLDQRIDLARGSRLFDPSLDGLHYLRHFTVIRTPNFRENMAVRLNETIIGIRLSRPGENLINAAIFQYRTEIFEAGPANTQITRPARRPGVWKIAGVVQ